MKQEVFTGVCTALITPFTSSGVDIPKLEELLDHQIEHGVAAVCVCGTTGEASTMTLEEKIEVISHTVRYCKGKIKIIAGTGSNNTAQAVAMSRFADAAGVDAVLVVTPYYNKATASGLISHYSAVADAVSCPVILYNVPSRTGVDIPLHVYKRLSNNRKIIGVKEASGDVSNAVRIMAECGDNFFVWSGNDDIIVPMMSLGAKGVISVFSNLCPEQTVAMCHACTSGDYTSAAKLQRRYANIIDALFSEVNPIPIKEAMNMAGFAVGNPRLPLCGMTELKRSHLRRVLLEHNIIQE